MEAMGHQAAAARRPRPGAASARRFVPGGAYSARTIWLIVAGVAILAGAVTIVIKYLAPLLLAAAPAVTATPAAAQQLGVNTTAMNYWSDNGFIDILKTSSDWSSFPPKLPIEVDANGMPQRMPAGASMISRMVYLPPASAQEPASYELTTDGSVTAEMPGATVVASSRGKTVFRYSGTNPNGVPLILRAIGRRPTFLHLSRADETALLAKGEIWRPAFLEQLKGFAVIRFMDWMNTNGSQFTDSYPSNAAAISYGAGVPIAVMNDLCAKTRTRCWFNIPANADDRLISSMIAAAPHAIFEPSNEVWNLGFPQAKQAQALGSDGRGAGGAAGWYGAFAARIGRLARGSGATVVLGWQTVVPERAQAVWDAVRQAGGKDSDFGGWIITTYVSGTLTTGDGPMLRMATANDIAGALNNIWHVRRPGSLSVDTMASTYAAQGAVARAHGLLLMAYESNFHLNAIPAFAGQQALVVPFVERIQRAPGAAAVMAANLDAFKAAGGSLNVFFNLSTPASGGGFFGIAGTPTMELAKRRMAQQNATP